MRLMIILDIQVRRIQLIYFWYQASRGTQNFILCAPCSMLLDLILQPVFKGPFEPHSSPTGHRQEFKTRVPKMITRTT